MSRPLAGTRVIDLTSAVWARWRQQILGDMGAEVLKIEPPQGDPIRLLGPSRDPGMDYSNCFGADSRNCRSESAIMSIGADLSAS